jgi:hypothetical protein
MIIKSSATANGYFGTVGEGFNEAVGEELVVWFEVGVTEADGVGLEEFYASYSL